MHLPMPSEQDLRDYYANDYRNDYHGERKPSKRRIMRAWNNGERIYQQIHGFLPKHARTFEVGAGIGCTVKVFEQHGFNASGTEPNKDFNSYTRQVLHAQVQNTNLFDLKLSHTQDAVMLIHVIEHFSAPTNALRHIRQLLQDHGMLYIECPNLSAPFATFSRLFHYAHTYNFTHHTLIKLAEACGFQVVQVFSDEQNPDIQILFKKTVIPKDMTWDTQEASRIEQAIHRYNALSYHLRPCYIRRRILKLLSYVSEWMEARSFVKTLEDNFNP